VFCGMSVSRNRCGRGSGTQMHFGNRKRDALSVSERPHVSPSDLGPCSATPHRAGMNGAEAPRVQSLGQTVFDNLTWVRPQIGCFWLERAIPATMRLALALSPAHPYGIAHLTSGAGEVVLHVVRALGQARLVMALRSASDESNCPACAQTSRRVHSRTK
jgi:hypothetical protein